MSDLISRQAAIDELDKGAWGVEWDKTLAKAIIRDAPSVVPTQTNTNQCVQRVEYVGDIEKKRCRTCKHFKSEFHTPISSDGTYYTYVICTEKECIYKEKG